MSEYMIETMVCALRLCVYKDDEKLARSWLEYKYDDATPEEIAEALSRAAKK